MELIATENDLKVPTNMVEISSENPLLIEKFLDDALELDIDVVCDGEKVLVGGILQHIEEAGIPLEIQLVLSLLVVWVMTNYRV